MAKRKDGEPREVSIYGNGTSWDTWDEIDWLNRIGETAMVSKPRPSFGGTKIFRSKRWLLESYVANASKRAERGNINPLMTVAHARELLAAMPEVMESARV